jgi:DNA-binding CsgD family transcriptional regulator
MMRRGADWIAVLEAGYSLDGDDETWLGAVMDRVAQEPWRDRVCVGLTFALKPTGAENIKVQIRGRPEMADQVQAVADMTPPEALDRMFRSGKVVSSLSELTEGMTSDFEARFRAINPDVTDVLAMIVHSGSGRTTVLTHLLDAPRRPTPLERRRWTRCAAHIGAGMRLRTLAPELASLDGRPIEAIFDGAGKLHDARAAATEASARERLREAVLAFDRVRSRAGRQDCDGALDAWEGLVQGRWSLIDRFDSDGRRFVVAVRNDPRFPDPRGLSLRERQVAEFAGIGRSAKEIAYVLGVSAASVDNSLRRAQEKLGLGSRVELAAFFSPYGVRAQLAQVAVADETLLIGSTPEFEAAKLGALTGAERAVLAMLIAGSTNGDIALRRGASPNTIANQVQSIFRKYGARSRTELVARLAV